MCLIFFITYIKLYSNCTVLIIKPFGNSTIVDVIFSENVFITNILNINPDESRHMKHIYLCILKEISMRYGCDQEVCTFWRDNKISWKQPEAITPNKWRRHACLQNIK